MIDNRWMEEITGARGRGSGGIRRLRARGGANERTGALLVAQATPDGIVIDAAGIGRRRPAQIDLGGARGRRYDTSGQGGGDAIAA